MMLSSLPGENTGRTLQEEEAVLQFLVWNRGLLVWMSEHWVALALAIGPKHGSSMILQLRPGHQLPIAILPWQPGLLCACILWRPPPPTSTQTPLPLVAVYLLSHLYHGSCLFLAQQLQTSQDLIEPVKFSIIRWLNHTFSKSECLPSLCFLGCSPSALGCYIMFPYILWLLFIICNASLY